MIRLTVLRLLWEILALLWTPFAIVGWVVAMLVEWPLMLVENVGRTIRQRKWIYREETHQSRILRGQRI